MVTLHLAMLRGWIVCASSYKAQYAPSTLSPCLLLRNICCTTMDTGTNSACTLSGLEQNICCMFHDKVWDTKLQLLHYG